MMVMLQINAKAQTLPHEGSNDRLADIRTIDLFRLSKHLCLNVRV